MAKNKKNPPRKKRSLLKSLLYFLIGLTILVVAAACPAYRIGEYFFNRYFNEWGRKLVNLEQRGLLSRKLGAAWQDVLKDEAMEQAAGKLLGADTAAKKNAALVVDGVFVNDYPSLSVIARLNAVQNYANEIRIADRRDRDIARIRTNHTRAKIIEFPRTFVNALVAAEDAGFWKNKEGVEYASIVRAAAGGILHSLISLRPRAPRGTSTITQQVAKLFISSVDEAGHRVAGKTMDRKLREMRLANALRQVYKPEEILEVYVNHCIASDNGLIGCRDIARALFEKDLKDLSDAQCVYLARMVKWGRNVKPKIARQCALDMPRIGKAMGWDAARQKKVLAEVQALTFKKPRQVQTDFGALVDCANEYWLSVLTRNGASAEQLEQMNIVDPNSLIRKKGNLFIRLTLDLPLQQELERLVKARGYGPDTVVMMGGKPILVTGQYYAYSIMDSKEGRLLAYCSKDKIGSRLSGLLRNRTPNGSSTAKPIFNALNFDLGTFSPYAKWNDSLEVAENVPWQRRFRVNSEGKITGVTFTHSAVKNRGYEVHNHGDVFEGCQYVFDQLNASNNILGVETVYRLNRTLFSLDGGISKEAFPLVQYFYRIGAFDRIRDELHLTAVTGVRVYKELARIVGAGVDSAVSGQKRVPISDSLYSVALGTLELTLYEQMHLFNVLYNNDLIERPADHPSLILDNIVLNGDTMVMRDTIKRYHPFADPNNLRPTYLGLHKRLVTNDGLDAFDLAPGDTAGLDKKDTFDRAVLPLEGPVSYIAKSGTTDDVIKPFDAAAKSGRKTNYGLWNAVLRLDLSRLAAGKNDPDVRDVTVSCIGECNEKYTGVRDGKTLHKFLTKGLMLRAGVQNPKGYFTRYEAYLRRTTPKDSTECGAVKVAEKEKPKNPFEQFLSIFKKKPDTTTVKAVAPVKVDSGGPVTTGKQD
ncbi:MAG TPA: transglycosylase domain-containing protein [Chitinivibrionales bacterium]|nr:transglycosylase domain-containing protein [Chitinivibrionales bacterium]